MTPPLRNPQFFYTTTAQPCPYLPARMERKILVDLAVPDADTLHSRLSATGFRRSHTLAYAPLCAGCSACIPIRLPVAAFAPSRTQKRVWNRNTDLSATLLPPVATGEQYELFRQYLNTRHADGEMANMTARDYRIMVEETTVDTQIIEFRTADNKLVAVSLTDTLDDGLSAVYSFYDPQQTTRSLGGMLCFFLFTRHFCSAARICIWATGFRAAPRWRTKAASDRQKSCVMIHGSRWTRSSPSTPRGTPCSPMRRYSDPPARHGPAPRRPCARGAGLITGSGFFVRPGGSQLANTCTLAQPVLQIRHNAVPYGSGPDQPFGCSKHHSLTQLPAIGVFLQRHPQTTPHDGELIERENQKPAVIPKHCHMVPLCGNAQLGELIALEVKHLPT